MKVSASNSSLEGEFKEAYEKDMLLFLGLLLLVRR